MRLPTLLICALLTACTVNVIPADHAPATAQTARATAAMASLDPSATSRPDTRAAESAAYPAELNFRIREARARIGSRDYVLDFRNRPVITAVGDNTYRLDLTLQRDSRASLRGDETLTTHFYYDGTELVFFGDKNRNQRFDRREAGVRHLITHTREFVTQGNKRFAQPRNLDITLRREHLSSYQRVDTLWLRLMFQEG